MTHSPKSTTRIIHRGLIEDVMREEKGPALQHQPLPRHL